MRLALYALCADDIDIVEVGTSFGRECLGGPEHDVAGVVNDDSSRPFFRSDLAHSGTLHLLRKDIKREGRHGNAVRPYGWSIRPRVRATGAMRCERVGGGAQERPIWPKASDACGRE